MLNKKQKYLIYLAALSTGTLLISNLAAVKLWDFFGIPVDGGIVVFPLTYIIGDLIVEFYGKESANHIVFAGFFINMIAVIVFYIVLSLPAYPGWNMQEAMQVVLGFTPRIIFASLLAFSFSNIFNNFIFTKCKQGNGLFARSFIARALGSSAVAHILDCMIFETIAFLGVLSFSAFILQASFAYLFGMALEIILSPIEVLIAKGIGRRLSHDNL